MDIHEALLILPGPNTGPDSHVSTLHKEAASWRQLIMAKLPYAIGCDPLAATERDWLVAATLAVRDRIVDRWLAGTRSGQAQPAKHVFYLSMKFLLGRMLRDSVNNLGLAEPMRRALAELGVDFERLR